MAASKFLNGVDLNNQRGINAADPSSATDLANKQYVDAVARGLRWKESVVAASTADGALATAYEDGDTLDGVTLATGDRILLKDQTDATENGVYVVAASGAPARAADAAAGSDAKGITVTVTGGTVNDDRVYLQTNTPAVVGTDGLAFSQLGGGTGTTYTADGQGIELSSTTFSLELNGATLSKSASGLKVSDSYAGAGLAVTTDVLAVGAGDGITVNSNDVALASSVAGAGLTFTTGVVAVGAGSGISVAADAVAIDTSVVARRYSTAVGNGSGTSFSVNHAFGRRDVQVYIYETASPFGQVFADVVHTDTNNVSVTFASAPTSNQYTVVVVG